MKDAEATSLLNASLNIPKVNFPSSFIASQSETTFVFFNQASRSGLFNLQSRNLRLQEGECVPFRSSKHFWLQHSYCRLTDNTYHDDPTICPDNLEQQWLAICFQLTIRRIGENAGLLHVQLA